MTSAPTPARPALAAVLAGALTLSAVGCTMFESPHATAERALRAGDYSGAIEAYSEAIAEGDYPAVAYANRCYAYQAAGDYDVAVHDCTEALDLLGEPDPSDYEDEAAADAALKEYTEILNNRAVANIGMRRYDDAIEDLDRAIELREDYAEAYANRGRVFVEQEEYEKAVEDLERAVELSPELAEAYGNWAQALTGLGDADGALEKFGKAIEVSGGSPDIHFNRASLLYAIGRFQEALADYRECAERSQNGQLQWMCEQQVIFLSGLDTPTPGGPAERTGTPAPAIEGSPDVGSTRTGTPDSEPAAVTPTERTTPGAQKADGTASATATARASAPSPVTATADGGSADASTATPSPTSTRRP